MDIGHIFYSITILLALVLVKEAFIFIYFHISDRYFFDESIA
jgi:hypothetical protein